MYHGETIDMVGDKFKLHFIENEGMAFGMQYGGSTGKIALTLFRVVAAFFIGYYLLSLVNKKRPTGLIISLSLIFAGAAGNIIDSVFYGVLFEGSDPFHQNIAAFLPVEGGYAPLLKGKVVDMLYFPLIAGEYPNWIPFLGGKDFLFFRPIFNIADSSITIGVFLILIFHRKFFSRRKESKDNVAEIPVNEPGELDPQSES